MLTLRVHTRAWPILRYGFALIIVAVALFATHQLFTLSSKATLLVLLWSVMVASWYGGPGPGLLAMAIGIMGADYFFLYPIGAFGIDDPSDHMRLIFFVGASLASVGLVWRQQQTQRRLARQNEALEHEIRQRQRTQKDLEIAHRQLQGLAERMTTIREDERAHISREVHDVLGQMLMFIRMEVATLSMELNANQEALRHRAQGITSGIDDLTHIVQRISKQLRPPLLDTVGLSAAVEWEIREFTERAGLKATTAIDVVDPTSVDTDRALAVFRVLQEGLTNIARHAQASRIHVALKRGADDLVLEMWDDGKGITAEAIDSPSSLGLLGMKERVRPFGGSVNISGTSGKGTTVSVTVPILGSASPWRSPGITERGCDEWHSERDRRSS